MEANLKASLRDSIGSAESRRLRNDGSLPAVIYGMGMDPVSVVLDAREFNNALRSCLLYTSPSPRDKRQSRMPSSA